jgi:putative peptidase
LKRSFLVTKDKVLTDKAPSEWKTALMSLVKNGESLHDFNDYTECLHGITPEMIQQMVNEMFDWNHRIVVYKSQK